MASVTFRQLQLPGFSIRTKYCCLKSSKLQVNINLQIKSFHHLEGDFFSPLSHGCKKRHLHALSIKPRLFPCSILSSNRRSLATSQEKVKESHVEELGVSELNQDVTTSSSSSSSDDSDDEDAGFPDSNTIKLSPLQKTIITLGTGISSFLDPTRAENIAVFGEISAGLVLNRLYQRMMEDDEGRRILVQKPRINSKTVDLNYLSTLPEDTLGKAYYEFLKKNNVTPDSRLPVRFIEDPELAYVMQRYREVHDLVHTVTGQPTNMLGEVVVKWIEGIQTGLPMCVTGGLFGATRLRPKQRQRYLNNHLKWAIDVGFTSKPFLYIFYEERWEQSLKDLQNYISPALLTPPSLK